MIILSTIINNKYTERFSLVIIMYDFNEIIERKGTCCAKYDSAEMFGKPEGLLPLWVADMDFKAPDPVREAVRRCADHGIFGYAHMPDSYFEAVSAWFSERFGFTPEKKWLVTTPGVVFAIATAVKAFTESGDAVIINRPVYYPFSNMINSNGRKLVNSPLVLRNGRYEIDFDDFEKKIIENDVKMYILCSPHNPVGRVWTEAELRKIGDICIRHNVIVISDEIHCDFVWSGSRHTCFASLGEEYADISVICTAPSKTFNIAGLQMSNIFIKNSSLRRRYRSIIDAAGAGMPSYIGMLACEAAYRGGAEWLEELKDVLVSNKELVRSTLEKEIPHIKLIEPEGTYLLWIDMRALSFTEEEIEQFITDAGLWLDGGTMFGPEGLGFQRINIACPPAVLKEALDRLCNAVKAL